MKGDTGGGLLKVCSEQLLASRRVRDEFDELQQCEQQRQRQQQRQQRDQQQWHLPAIFIIQVTRYEGENIFNYEKETAAFRAIHSVNS